MFADPLDDKHLAEATHFFVVFYNGLEAALVKVQQSLTEEVSTAVTRTVVMLKNS